MQKSKVQKIWFLIFFVPLIFTCRSDHDMIPYVAINWSFMITPDLSDVGVGCSKIDLNHGYKGLIIFHDAEGYKVFDLCCPNYPNDTCSVTIGKCAVKAVCPCCHSEFNMAPGSSVGDVVKGPARRGLKQYYAVSDGTYLNISN
jgi:hypothetical protein